MGLPKSFGVKTEAEITAMLCHDLILSANDSLNSRIALPNSIFVERLIPVIEKVVAGKGLIIKSPRSETGDG